MPLGLKGRARVNSMAYVPKPLVVGRCVRCGKKLYRSDIIYYCPHCEVLYCEICYRKLFGKCGICQKEVEMR